MEEPHHQDGALGPFPNSVPPQPLLPSRTARSLASLLLEIADSLDAHDLTAADALSDVRRASRALARAVHERGWGELYLGLDITEEDGPAPPPPVQEGPPEGQGAWCDDAGGDLGGGHGCAGDTTAEDSWSDAQAEELDDSGDDLHWEGQDPGAAESITIDLTEYSAEEGLPLPEGVRLSYQARFDFIVTDPRRLLEHVAGLAAQQRPGMAPSDIVEAVGLLAYYDGLGSRDYGEVGLEFAGGNEVVRPTANALWELSSERQDDTYPFD